MRTALVLGLTTITAALLPASADAADREPVTVYLHRGGGSLSAGWDDSAAGTSSLLWGHGVEGLEVPKFAGTDRQWKKIVACVRDKMSEFSIDITDERPAGGDYIMAMVSGRPRMLGYPKGVSGIAPYNGGVMAKAIVFVFEREMRADPEAVCTSAVHEVGHALGLDHAYLCEDPMSYLHGCGEKRFRDKDAWCGENEERACEGGGTQNSWRHLAKVLGLKNGEEPEPRRDPAPAPEPLPEDDGGEDIDVDGEPPPDTIDQDDPDGPAVEVVSPRADSATGNGRLEIVVSAKDRTGVADVQLVWMTPDESYILSCGAMPEQIDATCHRKGKNWVFSLDVGLGERAFAARAVDRDGHVRFTDGQTIWLTED